MPHAVIIGAGIGGLTAATGLTRHGWDVTVLDRVPAFTPIGAGLGILANGLHGLDTLGLGDTIRAAGHPDSPGGLRTPDGRWITRVNGADMERILGTTAIGIHRATLHQILLNAADKATVHTGTEVVAVDGTTVTYRTTASQPPNATGTEPSDSDSVEPAHTTGTDPSSATGANPSGAGNAAPGHGTSAEHRLDADLIVAADGINSRIRHHLWPDLPAPIYTGTTAWRAVTDRAWTDGHTAAITWGPGTEFGIVPLADGRVYWFASITTAPGGHHPDELAAVRQRFGDWHDPIPTILDATDPTKVIRTDLYHLATPPPAYHHGRIALLGDAAHAMTPTLGQGANQAIEDAVTLAALCRPGRDVAEALAEYTEIRRPRATGIARAALQMARIGQQLENPVAVAIRNTAMRLTPARIALRSMTKHADWKPPQHADR